MAVLVGLGLVQVFAPLPGIHLVLKLACVAYLLYLAWKIAKAAALKGGAARGPPMTFLQAAAFQWVNPKASAMALTAVTVYAPGQDVAAVLAVAVIFGVINLPSVGSWALGRSADAAGADQPRAASGVQPDDGCAAAGVALSVAGQPGHVIGQRPARLIDEKLGQDLDRVDAVDAEHTEGVAHLAPNGQGPDPPPVF